jgi:IS605 OrfB family transposase
LSILKSIEDVLLQKNAQLRVVGKVFKPNRLKILALNMALNEYFRLVEWYLSFNFRLKSFLHENCYEKAKELFKLNAALIQTAMDKAAEILKSFEENRRENSVLRLKGKEGSKVNQQLHIIANQIVAYVKRFQKPVIVMEDLNGIRSKFKRSKKINRRFHSSPFRRLQTIIKYKILLEVKYLTKKRWRTRLEHAVGVGMLPKLKREFRCPRRGLIYNRDLNAYVNIAHALMGGVGWGSCEPPKKAGEELGVKPTLNAGILALQNGVAHRTEAFLFLAV